MTEEKKNKTEEKPKKQEMMEIQLVRAVDMYHHKGMVIKVVADEYHKGLVLAGHAKLVGA